MKQVNVAIIGTGGIAGAHIGGYKALPNVKVVAVCDIDVEKAKAYAEKHGVPADSVYADYNEMLKRDDIDAVSVCTWNAAHAPATIAALDAGKHVICEKPMAMNTAEALAMEEAARRNNKLLMIGFVRRYGNDCKIVRDFIEADTIGDIYYAKATYLRRHGCPGRWFGDVRYSGGGPLIDLGVHVIDLSRYLMGCPKPVSVYGVTFHKLGNRPGLKVAGGNPWKSTSKDSGFEFSVEDMASAMIRFDNGAVLQVECSFDANIEQDVGNVELLGTKAGVKISPEIELFTEMAGYMVNVKPAGSSKLSFDGLFESEIAHFVDCVANGTQCVSPAHDGVILMQILDAIYESGRTGHEVLIGD